MFNLLRNRKGVALLLSIGILAIMSIIATSFALNMKLELEAAANYLRSVKALYLAESGINKVIADIRSQVASNTYAGVIAYVSGYDTTNEQSIDSVRTTYQVTIGRLGANIGEDQKVNLNALDKTDSIWIGTLQTAGLTYNDIAKIIDYRDSDTNAITQLCTSTGVQSALGDETNTKNAPYVSLEEVKLVIGDTKYESIKNNITIFAPIIRGGLIGEYFTNRTSFSSGTIFDLSYFKGKVVELGKMREYFFPGSDGEWGGWIESHDAEFAGCYLAVDWGVGFGLDQFGVIWTGFIYIPEDKVGSSITFYTRSDDGVRLYIDGAIVINDWVDSNMETPPGVSGSRTFNYSGWHSIRIEYYDQGACNGCELRWDALGSIDYVPAEYFGYYPAPYFGKYQPPAYPPATPDAYNSAGLYKITSTGKVKTADGAILAEKKITAVAKIFGTWTQTEREEFYAAWFSELNNFSDGEIKNVNWMDSCPKNASEDLEASGYFNNPTKFVRDSLKLGYWDNFDEDVAYSVVNLKGGKVATVRGVWTTKEVCTDGDGIKDATVPYQYDYAPDTTWNVSFGEFADTDSPTDGDYELKIWTPGFLPDGPDADTDPDSYPQDKYVELNSNYYSPDAYSGYDIFVRAWKQDWGQQQQNSPNWGYPPSQRLTNPGEPAPTYTPAWVVGYLIVKQKPYAQDPLPEYYTLLKDGDLDMYWVDLHEFTFSPPPPGYNAIDFDYDEITKSVVLGAVGVGTNYQGYVNNGALGAGTASANASTTGIVKLRGNNIYCIDTSDSGPPPADPPYYLNEQARKIRARNADWFGCDSENEARWDNVRIIYPKGYFVSTPFVSSLNSNPIWGMISWGYEPVLNTSITMSVRAGDSLATTDTGWTSVSNDSALAVTGKQIQYKAELSTSALSATSYGASGVTPILKDVTITYLPQVEIVFWKEETK